MSEKEALTKFVQLNLQQPNPPAWVRELAQQLGIGQGQQQAEQSRKK